MSKFEFKLPDIGEGVTEGEIVSWLIKVGDAVAEDQDMVEVMTDKATVTIGAPKAGTVSSLGGKEGDIVPVGNVLVVLDLGASKSASSQAVPTTVGASASSEKGEGPAATAVGDIRETLPGMNLSASPAPSGSQARPTGQQRRVFQRKAPGRSGNAQVGAGAWRRPSPGAA